MTAPALLDSTSTPSDTSSGDPFADVIASSVAATVTESDTANGQTRDDRGRFVPRAERTESDEETDATATPPGDTSTATDGAVSDDPSTPAPETPMTLPAGFVAVPKVEGRELVTPFTVMDAEGELEIPDITITFTANGKERREPLDKVVRLAQTGVHNEERQRAVEQTRAESQTVREQNAQLHQLLRQAVAEREQLFTSDDAYLTARARYEQENTPEARVQRAEAQVQEQQHRMEYDAAARQGASFVDGEVVPAIDALVTALPTIHPDEIAAKVLLITNGLRVSTRFGSIIPPHQHAAVRQAILADVVPWAQSLHDHRTAERSAQTRATTDAQARLQQATRDAQVEAQKKTSLLTRVTRPQSGTQGAPGARQAPQKPLVTPQDIQEDIVRNAVASVMSGG